MSTGEKNPTGNPCGTGPCRQDHPRQEPALQVVGTIPFPAGTALENAVTVNHLIEKLAR
jgi:hypothetical protein